VIADVAILRRTVYGKRVGAEEPETKHRGKAGPKGRGTHAAKGSPKAIPSSHGRPKSHASQPAKKKKGQSKDRSKRGKRR
jgi:hypothetical protein